jgi:hypothetical protein
MTLADDACNRGRKMSTEGIVAGPATIREGIDRRLVERAADHEAGQAQRGNGHV